MRLHTLDDPNVRSFRMSMAEFKKRTVQELAARFKEAGLSIDRELEIVIFEADPRELRFEPSPQ